MKKIYVSILAIASLLTAFFFFVNNFKPLDLKESEQGNADDPFGASRYRFEMIAGNKGFIDPSARIKAINYTIENLQSDKLMKVNGISGWSNLGPGNIGGRIRGIVISKTTPATMLIGSVSGGIWKTTNGGTSWSPKLDNGVELSIGCLVKDPTNDNTVYAGTGEGWGNSDAVYGGGIYKSTDFGDTWTLLSSTIADSWSFKNVLDISFDPSNNIYAITKSTNRKDGIGSYLTNGGLYKSTDGGTSWNKVTTTVPTNYFNGCAVIPFSTTTIVFATGPNGSTLGGIFRSTNSGTTWTQITTNLPSASYRRISFAKDPNNANTAYAVFESTVYTSPTYGLSGIYKTTDAGATWTALTRPGNLTSTGYSYLSTQGWYDNVIAVDPYNSSNIYIAGVEMMKSTNGGTSWAQLTFWDPYYGSPVVHADHHAITFDPVTSGIVYDGDDGGIYKTINSGATWTALNNTLEITQFYGGAVYPTGSTYFGGTQDNGHLKFSAGTSWTTAYGGDGGYAAQDQTNSLVSYEEYVYLDMSKSTDGGTSWSSCISGLTDATNSASCLFIAPFSMNPENSSVLAAGSKKVWITSNSAGTWTQSSNALSTGLVSAVTVVNATSPYLGIAGTTDGKVFKCVGLDPASGVDTWTDITPSGNNAAYVRRITVDPTDKQKIYVCYSGYNNTAGSKHIWYSTNQGTSWTDISTGLPDVPVHSLVVDNVSPTNLYIGTETGVYQTTDRGTTWTAANTGMPAYVPVDELVYQTGTNKIFAFTHGRGAFITSAPLPIEIASFTSLVFGNSVSLKWTTKSEINSHSFEIERGSVLSNGEIVFSGIGKIIAAGNSVTSKDYTFTDNNLAVSQYRYRIKMVDNDGKFKYSEVINVNIVAPSDFSISQNYPNPFNPVTSIRYSIPENTNVKLSVYNIKGEFVKDLVDQFQAAGEYSVNVKGNDWASGIYFYKIETGKFSVIKKMVLLK
jgi:photosystem II stability/assembly factor-like uncharacterized protein